MGNVGDKFFLQVSSTPLVSLFITTRSEVDILSKKKKVDLRFVSQPSSYPKEITSQDEMDRIGYNLLITSSTNKTNLDVENNFGHISLSNYKKLFCSTCMNIDAAIKEFHGIKCYRDDNATNKSMGNIHFLQICDIFNVMVCKHYEVVPEITVKTSLFQERYLPTTVTNEFEDVFLEEDNYKFLLCHIDHFYMIYCY